MRGCAAGILLGCCSARLASIKAEEMESYPTPRSRLGESVAEVFMHFAKEEQGIDLCRSEMCISGTPGRSKTMSLFHTLSNPQEHIVH